jgi:CubicO group peptidase (beta-lactamase class C family)
MLKKLLISLGSLAFLGSVGLLAIGISPLHIGAVAKVAVGLGAKIACSGQYITGLNEAEIVEDLAGYSPATRLLNLHYSENQVSASFLGMAEATAIYRGNLGCTLEHDQGTASLDEVNVPELANSILPWPAGENVTTIDPKVQRLLDQIMQDDNANGLDTRALLVVKSGKILAETYATGFDESTPFLGWSMGKSLTSIMVGNLHRLGKVSVEQRNLFPEWSDKLRAEISLENLLHMSSGLAFSETYIPGTDSTRMLFIEAGAADFAIDKPLEYPPGEHFSYASGTTNILMRYVYDKVGGTPQHLVDYFYKDIARPLGLANTVFEPDANGVMVGSSYIYASARDWARMGQVMVGGGRINDRQILDLDWVKSASSGNSSANDGRYGYQFWLNSGEHKSLRWPILPQDSYAMMGNRQQKVFIIPSLNIVIVRLGWTTGGYPTQRNFEKIIDAVTT